MEFFFLWISDIFSKIYSRTVTLTHTNTQLKSSQKAGVLLNAVAGKWQL